MSGVSAPLQLLLMQLFSLATHMVNNATRPGLVEGAVLSALNATQGQDEALLFAVQGIEQAQLRAAAALESIAQRNDTSEKCSTEVRVVSSLLQTQLDSCRQELTKLQGVLEWRPEAFELALREAAKIGDKDSVSALLKIGVKATAADGNLYTALHWAAWYGHVGAVKVLLDGGAFIEAKDKDEKTPLHWAAYGPSSKAVGPLLDWGAAVNALDKYAWTPLHWAAYTDRVEAARVLLARGASTIVRGYQRRTPLEVAKHYSKPGVTKLLSG